MDVLVTSKNKEDPNKNEGARVATTQNIDFSHSQGQIPVKKLNKLPKFSKLSFCQKLHSAITFLHANVQWVYIM